jgi:1-acyl-sn-glycerol-3-phosphate acyltransferase
MSKLRRTLAFILVRPFLKLIVHGAFGMQIEGLEHVTRFKGSVILAGNHTGLLDGPMIMAAVKRPVCFMVNRQVFTWRGIGPVVKQLGPVGVNQEQPKQAILTSLQVLKQNEVFCIFPEGRLTDDGNLCPFQEGLALLHIKSGVPIVPFAIHGGFEAWPKDRRWPRWKKIKLTFGPPVINPEMPRAMVTQEIYNAVANMLGQPLIENSHNRTGKNLKNSA